MNIDLNRAWSQLHKMLDTLVASLPGLIVAVLLIVAFTVLGTMAKRGVRNVMARSGRSPSVGLVVGSLLQWALVVMGLLVGLSVVAPSVQARDLMNLLGISGLAIGFAFKDIFQNFLAGILILITEPFRIGDQIAISGFEGLVEDIHTRATSIRTLDGRRVVIPNSVLFTEAVSVATAFGERQSEQEIHVPADRPVEEQKHEALEAIREIPGVASSPPPTVLLSNVADGNIVMQLRWWTAPQTEEVQRVRDRVLSALKSKSLVAAS